MDGYKEGYTKNYALELLHIVTMDVGSRGNEANKLSSCGSPIFSLAEFIEASHTILL